MGEKLGYGKKGEMWGKQAKKQIIQGVDAKNMIIFI